MATQRLHRRTETGCRPNSLINVPWAIDAAWLDDAASRVESLISSKQFEVTLKDSKEKNESENDGPGYEVDDHGLAHVYIEGPITKYPTSFSSLFGGTSTVMTQKALRDAANDPRIKSIALHFDTPGGTVPGVSELGETIAKIGETKPVHGIITGSCCSAGMWLASQCVDLCAEPTNEIGSVGGMCILTDSSENLTRQGIKRILIKSEGAEFKGIAAPGVKVSDADIKEVENRLNDMVKYFLSAVQSGRSLSDKTMEEVKRARVYEAEPAKKLGLIDQIAYEQDRVAEIHDAIAKGVDRGRTSQAPIPPAAPRSVAMFTAEQMQRIKKLPGGDGATEANAQDLVITVAEKTHQELTDAKAKLDEAKKNPPTSSTVQAPSQDAVDVKCERIDLMVEKQTMTKAQGEALKTKLKDNTIGFFSADGKNIKLVDGVLEVLSMGKTGFSPKPATGIQPEPVASNPENPDAEPTAEDKLAEQGRKQGEKARDEILRRQGVSVPAH